MEAGTWRRSSLSTSGKHCVEVRENADGTVDVRSSHGPGGPVLHFLPAEWDAFIGGAEAGEFDLIGTEHDV